MGDAGYNRIANAGSRFSGMMWTYNEFPFATYETPYLKPYHESETETFASAVLLKEVPEREHTAPHRTQHVDFQSNALSALREAVLHKRAPPATKATTKGIWRYHFKTQFQPDTELATCLSSGIMTLYKILRRSWDRHLVGNGSAVDLEQGNLKRSMGQMQSRDNENGTVGLSADWLNASGNGTNPARQASEDLP
ncbi:hypothetical protein QWA68_015993 [Fusarium oxysporum]|nr:hypothetical protein QWA68_015993 [Fusarium oxysporum]